MKYRYGRSKDVLAADFTEKQVPYEAIVKLLGIKKMHKKAHLLDGDYY